MIGNTKIFTLITILLTNEIFFIACQSEPEQNKGRIYFQEVNNTCNDDELNHSTLVECKSETCSNALLSSSIWPSNNKNIIHLYSSRQGDRFQKNVLPNLDYQETEYQRMLDINTTIYVNTSSVQEEIFGFGTNIDLGLFLSSDYTKEKLELVHKPIFRDLFAGSDFGVRFSFVRLSLNHEIMVQRNVSKLLIDIDKLITDAIFTSRDYSSKIRLILNINGLDKSHETINSLKAIAATCSEFEYLKCYAISVGQDWILKGENKDGILDYIQELFSVKTILAETDLEEASNVMEALTNSQRQALNGLLLKSSRPLPYNNLQNISLMRKNSLSILTTTSDRQLGTEFGDWQNAQNYAVEVLNQLRYGSNGIIDETSSIDVFNSSHPKRDSLIYSLRATHDTHFRSPIFYAMGHFSRYLSPGSIRVDHSVVTQPNMFNTHQIAFVTPNDYLVVIVLNNNEHMLPLRIAMDDQIVANTMLQAKSFNSFAIHL